MIIFTLCSIAWRGVDLFIIFDSSAIGDDTPTFSLVILDRFPVGLCHDRRKDPKKIDLLLLLGVTWSMWGLN